MGKAHYGFVTNTHENISKGNTSNSETVDAEILSVFIEPALFPSSVFSRLFTLGFLSWCMLQLLSVCFAFLWAQWVISYLS